MLGAWAYVIRAEMMSDPKRHGNVRSL